MLSKFTRKNQSNRSLDFMRDGGCLRVSELVVMIVGGGVITDWTARVIAGANIITAMNVEPSEVTSELVVMIIGSGIIVITDKTGVVGKVGAEVDGVGIGEIDGIRLGEVDGVGVGDIDGIGLGEDGVGDGEVDGVGLGEGDGVGLREGEGVGLGEGDGVGLGEGDGMVTI